MPPIPQHEVFMIVRSIPMESNICFHCPLLSFASACSMQCGKSRREPWACIEDRSWSINHSCGSITRITGSSTPNIRGYSSRHNNVAAGSFRGVWTRDGSMLQIRQVVQISDGTQNFDVIDIDMLKDTFVIKAYTLK